MVLLSCNQSGTGPKNPQCPPDVPYAPQGEIKDGPEPCAGDTDSGTCPYYCSDASFCSGTVGKVYCERCSDLDAYLNGDCFDCQEDTYRGYVVTIDCPEYD